MGGGVMPMQHVFSFTIAEAWAFLIYAAGAAAGLYAGGVAISKVIAAVKKPKTDQDKRITQLEARVNAMEGFLKNDKLRLDRMDEGQHVTMQALLALLDHNLDGNNIDQMQKAKEALQNHLIG
jgi:hypothetical protein